jgi:CheY-like chemotaxis protein
MPESVRPVLYVEDEENDALLVKLAFRQAGVGCPVRIVADGREALDYLLGCGSFADREQHPLPWLVLLDLNLPKVSGFEVLERARQEPELTALPIVIFTSSGQETDREQARNLGATDYFIKPHSIPGVAEIARKLEERWLTPCPPVVGAGGG